jgi:deoxyribodipyrimidine photolyase-related protein
MRHLLLILGDQLAPDHPLLREHDPALDHAVLIEAPGEATHVWSHPARIAVFIAAMRQFSAALAGTPWAQAHTHVQLGDAHLAHLPGLIDRLRALIEGWRAQGKGPASLTVLEPGEWRLAQGLKALCTELNLPLRLIDDPHFLCSRAEFTQWARGKQQLRMEFFYRWMRQRTGVLMEPAGQGSGEGKGQPQPVGGAWNFDADNRQPFPKGGPGLELAAAPPARFEPDALTRQVLQEVRERFPDHPGALDSFAWPVTRAQALHALHTFVGTRLAQFGPYQDAQWAGEPFGWHSLLSVALNLHLLDQREVIAAAEQAWRRGEVPLASAEGFIRQILGWREFIRGMYWLDMPGLAQANHLQAHNPLPAWFWTGDTDMACLRDAIGQTLRHGYAHHIQRLMVTGLYTLLAGTAPQQVADWYLAVYVDAIEWVELPNVAGMALYANGGRFTSKPYAASGAYIHRMSNHCQGCRYKPTERTGPRACPITTLYWAFLDRHESELAGNPRTALMVKHLSRMAPAEREAVREAARVHLAAQAPHLPPSDLS